MKITLVAVGKLKEKFWVDACAEYLKRLKPYARMVIKEVPDIDSVKGGGIESALKREGTALLSAVDTDSYVVLLAIEGKEKTSTAFSRHLDDLALSGQSNITFIVGGSDGVSDEVRARADEMLSFGRITLPHNLARVVLLEQIYRAFKISRGEPYHK